MPPRWPPLRSFAYPRPRWAVLRPRRRPLARTAGRGMVRLRILRIFRWATLRQPIWNLCGTAWSCSPTGLARSHPCWRDTRAVVRLQFLLHPPRRDRPKHRLRKGRRRAPMRLDLRRATIQLTIWTDRDLLSSVEPWCIRSGYMVVDRLENMRPMFEHTHTYYTMYITRNHRSSPLCCTTLLPSLCFLHPSLSLSMMYRSDLVRRLISPNIVGCVVIGYRSPCVIVRIAGG